MSFLTCLRDAVLVMNPADVEDVAERLRQRRRMPDARTEDLRLFNSSYFSRNCRRYVPPPEQLVARMNVVRETFCDIKDADTSEPLFSDKTRRAFDNLVAHAAEGCMSDPEGVSMYYKSPTSSSLHCIRGSSALEGFHFHIRRLVGLFNMSPDLLHALMIEHVFVWNMDCGIRNRGDTDYGHHDYSLLEDINEVDELLNQDPSNPSLVSTKSFADTGERFGITTHVTTNTDSQSVAAEADLGDDGSLRVGDQIESLIDECVWEEDEDDDGSIERRAVATPAATRFAQLQGVDKPVLVVDAYKQGKAAVCMCCCWCSRLY